MKFKSLPIVFMFLLLMGSILPVLAYTEERSPEGIERLENLPMMPGFDKAFYYKERIHDINDFLYKEDIKGRPFFRNGRGDLVFPHETLKGPNGEKFREISGSIDISDGEGSYGYRTYTAILPSDGLILKNRDEMEKHLHSLNMDEDSIKKAMEEFTQEKTKPTGEVETIDAGLAAIIEKAAPDDYIHVSIRLKDDPPLDLPGTELARQLGDPAILEERKSARMQAIRERKEYMLASQADLVDFLIAGNAKNIRQSWLNNSLVADRACPIPS